MKKAIFLVALLFMVSNAMAHSGRTDRCGGHNNRKTGGYHVHNQSLYCACNPNSARCASKKGITNTQSKSVQPLSAWNCPNSHPIKGNINLNKGTRIYHPPGGTYYDRTKPEKCFATTENAVADGFRKPKR